MTVQADAHFDLEAAVGRIAAQLGRTDQHMLDLLESVTVPEPQTISFTGSQAPYVAPHWGPALGFYWFPQLFTVGPLGSSDTLAMYRGASSNDNVPQRLRYQWLGSATASAWQAWTPGKTAFPIDGGRESLVFDGGSGSLTSGTRYYVNVIVMQVARKWLAEYVK